MKSAQINEYGGSEIIKINQSTPQPTASSGKVLVTIKAAGVNSADWKIREGGLQRLVALQFLPALGWTFLELLNKLEKVIPLQTLREMRYMGRLVW
jgi:NADPH:quinone reductase-like Zn-dependent oxidoreductase